MRTKSKKIVEILKIVIIIFLMSVFFIILNAIVENTLKHNLESHGILFKARVIEQKRTSNGSMSAPYFWTNYEVFYEYKIKNIAYRNSESVSKEIFENIKDSVDVLYSQKHPNVSIIKNSRLLSNKVYFSTIMILIAFALTIGAISTIMIISVIKNRKLKKQVIN